MRNTLISILLLLGLLPFAAHADEMGAVTPGTRGTQSALAGCTYVSGGFSPSTGQQMALSCDNAGNLKISGTVSPTGTQDVNLTQVAGASVKTGHGTASDALRVELPTDGTGVVGLNAGSNIVGKVGIDQTTPGTTNLVSAAQNGTWTVGQTSVSRTAALSSVTTSGSVASGKQSVTIANVGSAAGTVLGVSVPAGASVGFSVNGTDTLGSIAYDATGTTFLIATIT